MPNIGFLEDHPSNPVLISYSFCTSKVTTTKPANHNTLAEFFTLPVFLFYSSLLSIHRPFLNLQTFWESIAGWWLNQPIWKIWVKMGIFPNFRDEHKKYLKPPPRLALPFPFPWPSPNPQPSTPRWSTCRDAEEERWAQRPAWLCGSPQSFQWPLGKNGSFLVPFIGGIGM